MGRTALTVLGALLLLAGLLWAAQGAGLVMWPADSFMLQQRSWVLYGLITAMIGVGLIVAARRRR